MAKPQIPADWHPATYAVDEPNKVVWRQGSYAVAMGLKGKQLDSYPWLRDPLVHVRQAGKYATASRAQGGG